MSRRPRRELLTVGQAAARFGVAKRTIYKWLDAKRLDTVRTPGGAVRIAADSLRAVPSTLPVVPPVVPPRPRVAPLPSLSAYIREPPLPRKW